MKTMHIVVLLLAFSVGSILTEENTNLAKAYKYASDFILEGLDKNAKPCDNPFNFMCGKWYANLEVKNETQYFYEDSSLKQIANDLIAEALQSIDVNNKDTPVYKIWTKTCYDQCLNFKLDPIELLKQIFNGVQRVIGPPPLLTLDQSVRDTLTKRNIWHLAGLVQRKLVEGVFFRANVYNEYSACGGSMTPVIYIEPPWSFGTVESDLDKTVLVERFMGTAAIFGVSLDQAKVETAVTDMIDFDKDLKIYGNSSLENIDLWEYVDVNSTDNLKTLIPNIDWQEYFTGLFSQEQLYYWDQTTARFKIRNKQYFLNIDEVVKKHSVDTIFNLIFYQAMNKMMFFAAFAESIVERNRTAMCIDNVKTAQTTAVAKIIMDYTKQDPMEWRADIGIIADNVKSALKTLAAQATWLSDQDTAAVYNKLNLIKFTNPIPLWFNDINKVENVTIKFEADKGAYDNAINIAKRGYVLELERYIKQLPADETVIFSDTSVSYSYFETRAGFGSVLPPYYQLRYPPAVKYGSLGVQLARAVLQAFTQDSWWESYVDYPEGMNVSSLNFIQNEISCLDEQITVLDCKQDDPTSKCPAEKDWSWNASLSNNLKEIGALKVAYTAYHLDPRSKSEQSLPVLSDYNSDNMFFLAAGRRMCGSYLTDSEQDGGLTVNKNRVVKVFRNLPQYGKSFQCPTGSNAISTKRCGLWAMDAA